MICGRSRERTAAFARTLKAGERVSIAFLDRAVATTAQVSALDVLCVVDAAGPFQLGETALVRSAIEAGVHYVDLADARAFVAGFGAFDEAAKARGVLAVTGASSTPALAQAVLDELCHNWKRIDTVEMAISPGAQAPLGLSVVRAILSYAGKPVRIWRHGHWDSAPGWGLLKVLTVEGLGRRLVSLVETPDLDIVPARFPSVRLALFRAGVELSLLHMGLWLLSLPVRLGLTGFLEPLAELLHAAAGWFRRFGSDRGAMTVDVSGVDAGGARVQARWALIAESGDGPNIPALPALALVRRLLAGEVSARGAQACIGLLPLNAIEAEFKRFEIRTARHVEPLAARSLFERTLPTFSAMPAAVREAHAVDPACDMAGEVETTGPDNIFGQIIGRIIGFPTTSGTKPAAVTIEREGDGEVWLRRFGTFAFQSHLSAGDKWPLVERFGPLSFDLEAPADERGFALKIARARLGELPLPKFLTPSTNASASVDEQGRYRFDVTIGLPLIGRLVTYRGWLERA